MIMSTKYPLKKRESQLGDNKTKKIALSGIRGKGLFVLVDSEDYDDLSKYEWHLDTNGYAVRRATIFMHREIINTPEDLYTDHVNGKGLDNRKANLRWCTSQQNSQNRQTSSRNKTSIYKGVTRSGGKWQSEIRLDGKLYYIGKFDKERHAAMAYNIWAKELFGEFSKLNFKKYD